MAEFPVFTICPSFGKSYKRELLRQDGLSVKDMYHKNFPKDKDSLAYLKRVTHNVSELIKSITFTLADHKGGIIEYDSESDLLHNTVEANDIFHFGRCFSLTVPQEVKNLKVYILNTKVKVIFVLLFISIKI